MFFLPPSEMWKVIQTWCVSNRLQCPPLALVAEPPQQLHLGFHRSGIQAWWTFFVCVGGVGVTKKKQTSNLSRFFTVPSLKAITPFQCETTRRRSKRPGVSEMGSLWRKDGRTGGQRREKHLLRCLAEAEAEEMLVHTLQQAKELDLHVGARRTRRVAPARFLIQDVGEVGTKNFRHEASVF